MTTDLTEAARAWAARSVCDPTTRDYITRLADALSTAEAEAAMLKEAVSKAERSMTYALGLIVEFGDLNGFRNLSDDELGRTVTSVAVNCSEAINFARAALESTRP